MSVGYHIPDINEQITLFKEGTSYNTKIKIYPDGSTIKVHASEYIYKYKDPLKDFKEVTSEPDLSDTTFFDGVSVDLSDFEEIKTEEEQEEEFLSNISVDALTGEVFRKKTDFYDLVNNKMNESVSDADYNDFLRGRARKRAKDRIFDICMCNDWQYFFTGTFDFKDKNKDLDNDPRKIMNKLNNWLAKQVFRKGLKYLLVAEYSPKNHLIHFHGLISGDISLELSDTVSFTFLKKPIKIQTAIKRKYDLSEARPVYHLKDWSDKFGFTTCIPVYGKKIHLSRYITKYITKDNDKIFGNYYFSSRNIKREPDIIYTNELFDDVMSPMFSCAGIDGYLKYEMDFPK